jgi:FtsH-binding integral membrane protein
MIGVFMNNLVQSTILSILFLYSFLSEFLAVRRFPGEDPRKTLARFSLGEQLLPLLLVGGIHGITFVLARASNLLPTYEIIVKVTWMLSVVALLFYRRNLNKRYGNPLDDIQLKNFPIKGFIVAFLITLVVFSLLIGYLRLPTVYVYLAQAIFMVSFIVFLIWIRHLRLRK